MALAFTGLRDLDPRTATTACSAILNHYPGTIGQVVLLDSPWTFKVRSTSEQS